MSAKSVHTFFSLEIKKNGLIWCLKTLALVIVDDYLLLLPAVCKAEFPSDLLLFNSY